MFGAAAYLTRATFLRAAGSLAGGGILSAGWIIKLRIDYAMGWWRSAFSETPDPLTMFSVPVMSLILAFVGGALFLVSWRITRRFGWAGQVAMLLIAPMGFAVRDRIWWKHFMRMMVITPGIRPVLADAALLALAMMLGYMMMRTIAGPAGNDPLARSRSGH
jgi:hypothetical protein